MPDVSKIEVRFGADQPALILDGDLALSQWGLMIAARLAQSSVLWLPRSIWPLIDSDGLYRRDPDLLGKGGEHTAEALSAWHAVWQSNRLRGRFQWFGDVRHEGQLPESADEHLHQRFETALSALHGCLDRDNDVSGYDWRVHSLCDALATAAALSPQLTILVARRDSLDLLTDIATRADLDCREVRGAGLARAQALAERYVCPSLPPLLCNRIELVAVHVAAPNAMLLPWGAGDGELWGTDDPDFTSAYGAPPEPWANSSIGWHGV